MEDRYVSTRTIVMSFLAGAAAGAAVALLTTPKRGSEMRAQLKDWASNSKVSGAVHRAASSARRAFDESISELNPDH